MLYDQLYLSYKVIFLIKASNLFDKVFTSFLASSKLIEMLYKLYLYIICYMTNYTLYIICYVI